MHADHDERLTNESLNHASVAMQKSLCQRYGKPTSQLMRNGVVVASTDEARTHNDRADNTNAQCFEQVPAALLGAIATDGQLPLFLTKEGGEGWGEEVFNRLKHQSGRRAQSVKNQKPLSPSLSPFVPHGRE